MICAAQIQRRLKDTPIATPRGPLQIRIGLHTGVAGPTNGDYTATTIDKTARIQAQAEGGQILISFQTHALVAGSVRGLCFRKAGAYDSKGRPPEDLYAVEELPPLASVASEARDTRVTNACDDAAQQKNANERGKTKRMSAAVGLLVLLCGGLLVRAMASAPRRCKGAGFNKARKVRLGSVNRRRINGIRRSGSDKSRRRSASGKSLDRQFSFSPRPFATTPAPSP